jgi:phosphatidylserine/phosphatidylglycerophosphate/cardiolipin synthase-like enzyme
MLYMRALAGLMTLTSAFQPAFAGSRFPASTEAQPLTGMEIVGTSSSGALGLTKARLITDNDAAFEQKLKIIEAAKDNLYLVYYIYAGDYSSSKFNKALIAKAQSGTKVHIMVDLLTNYSRMDLFRYLEYMGSQGNKGGYIQVRFYNKPSQKIQQDAYYFSMPCSHENQVSGDKEKCKAEKEAKLAANQISPKDRLMQKLWLAGTYSKNGKAAGVATASGQELDLNYVMKVAAADKAKKNDFKKVVKQGKETLETGSLGDKLKLKSLIDALAAEIDPTIGLMMGILPVKDIREENKQDWDHITDYNHQKMILADVGNGKYVFELGGRNIEDSYHLKTEQLAKLKDPKDEKEKQKYLFKDTDFYGEVASGGEAIKNAYMRNFNFSQMVATTAEMDQLAPFDLAQGVSECKGDPRGPEFQKCVAQFFQMVQTNPGSLKEKAMQRVMQVAKDTEMRAAKFEAAYVKPTESAKYLKTFRGDNQSDELSADDLSVAQVTYIENLNTSKDGNPQRTFGALTGRESETGKYISQLWQRGMESACALQKPTQVILHSAYLLPSSSMLKTLAKMFDGTWDCRQVTLKIITNSFDTTDLNVINIIARGEMQAVFNKWLSSYNPRSARPAYYEYAKTAGQTQSLHTKLSVLGDDMIVGSANADVRSYYMDANNGVYIHNGHGLVADYTKFIDSLIKSGEIVDRTAMFLPYDYTTKAYSKATHQEDAKNMTLKMCDYWLGKLKNPATRQKLINFRPKAVQYFGGLANDAFDSATAVMTPASFVPAAKDVQKVCGQEPAYNPDMSAQSDNYQSCVNKVRAQELPKVDPAFNLKMQTY